MMVALSKLVVFRPAVAYVAFTVAWEHLDVLVGFAGALDKQDIAVQINI